MYEYVTLEISMIQSDELHHFSEGLLHHQPDKEGGPQRSLVSEPALVHLLFAIPCLLGWLSISGGKCWSFYHTKYWDTIKHWDLTQDNYVQNKSCLHSCPMFFKLMVKYP